jgi:hypothetical protein
MRPGHGGYESKTKAPRSVCVYGQAPFAGLTPCQAVFARFAAVRLSCPQPEVTWTLVRILDWAGVRASR